MAEKQDNAVSMHFHVMTLFPDMIEQAMNTSVIGRAMKNNILSLDTIDIRDYSLDKHKRVDDYPYGGGAGMVMTPQPVYLAYEAIKNKIQERGATSSCRVIYLTPQGKPFRQSMAQEFAKEEDLVFLCGHYEGIDERVLDMIVTDYVSIGDYVLTGGELPVMVMMDAISRLVPGVLNNDESAEFDSFQDNLLEYPQYTRPEDFLGHKVPEVLLSGHHAKIEQWRREKSIERTLKVRPDLLSEANLSKKEKEYLRKCIEENKEK